LTRYFRFQVNPINLYGMFQMKTWAIPFWILRVENVNDKNLLY